MIIKCVNCGKHYNFDIDEICPNCGEYTRPNKKYFPQNKKQERKFEYNEPRKRTKRDFDKPQNKRMSGNYTQKQNGDENKSEKKPKGIAAIIPFIVVILSMFPSVIGDIFDYIGNDFPSIGSEQVDTAIPVKPVITFNYFNDNVTTNIAEYTINSVEELTQNYESDNKIIAINLSSELNDEVYEEYEIYDIYIEYPIDNEGNTIIGYDMFYYKNIPEIYSEIEHYDTFSVPHQEHTEGTLLFEVPKDISKFTLIIEEIEYDKSSDDYIIEEIYKYGSEFEY